MAADWNTIITIRNDTQNELTLASYRLRAGNWAARLPDNIAIGAVGDPIQINAENGDAGTEGEFVFSCKVRGLPVPLVFSFRKKRGSNMAVVNTPRPDLVTTLYDSSGLEAGALRVNCTVGLRQGSRQCPAWS